ncbi:MAG: hypothetical protein J6Y56_04325 [Fibrobacterales bacterium]|nr:hypothetical protein [Fibrobacterales bacterium]
MRTTTMLIPALAAAMFLASCAAPRPDVFFDRNAGAFSKETPITIVNRNDVTNTKNTLQIKLQKKGFLVRSSVAAKETSVGQGGRTKTVEQGMGYGSVNTLDQSQREYTQESQNYTQQTYRKYGSEYLMSLTYAYTKHDNDKYYYNSFSAEIASQETGEILMSIQYPRSSLGYEQKALLDDLIGRMKQCAEKGRCTEKSYQGDRVPEGDGMALNVLNALADEK